MLVHAAPVGAATLTKLANFNGRKGGQPYNTLVAGLGGWVRSSGAGDCVPLCVASTDALKPPLVTVRRAASHQPSPCPRKIFSSVMAVICTPALEVLLIARADRPGFWQSVTGSLDALDEPPDKAV